MSAFEVLHRYGTWALLRFVLALLVFVALHLVRLPLLGLARVLEVCMRRVDGLVVSGLPPRSVHEGPKGHPRSGGPDAGSFMGEASR